MSRSRAVPEAVIIELQNRIYELMRVARDERINVRRIEARLKEAKSMAKYRLDNVKQIAKFLAQNSSDPNDVQEDYDAALGKYLKEADNAEL